MEPTAHTADSTSNTAWNANSYGWIDAEGEEVSPVPVLPLIPLEKRAGSS